MQRHTWLPLAALLAMVSCNCPTEAPTQAAASKFALIDLEAFNDAAILAYLPLQWRADADDNKALDPAELNVLWGLDTKGRDHWVKGGAFTDAFAAAYKQVVATASAAAAPTDPREKVLRQELAQSYFTVLDSDLSDISASERTMVRHVLTASRLVEDLFHLQIGSAGLTDNMPDLSGPARMVFYLNQGPWCSGPATAGDANCKPLPGRGDPPAGLYPAAMQQDDNFCKQLTDHPDAKSLLSPFTAVRTDAEGKLTTIPFTKAWPQQMQAVAVELNAAAAALSDESEAPFKAYLHAAARAFGDNNWQAADEAWAAMNAHNSKWYLRIGPDEVYSEPCSRKAAFHAAFARINPSSVRWQTKLDPVKNDMEKAIAAKAGAPYQARTVSFHLPDFIDIIVNAGDSRSARGATVGQSLPNWGPVANEGRGRTVAMTNFYTDPKSRDIVRKQAASLLCEAAMEHFTDDAEPQLMSTVLHEAAHNLGPAHEYKVNGKTDDEIFGGPLASMMEELKAQTAALFLIGWLNQRGVLAGDEANRAQLRDINWAFGHISRGLYSAEGRPRPYSQLAAVQLGHFLDTGAVRWDAAAKAANGADTGCFAVDFGKLPGSVDALAAKVFGIKARGDVAGAKALKARYVDMEGERKALLDTLTERMRRFPKASFLYAVSGL